MKIKDLISAVQITSDRMPSSLSRGYGGGKSSCCVSGLVLDSAIYNNVPLMNTQSRED